MLLTAASSDYFRERSLHIAGAMTVTMIGFIVRAFIFTSHVMQVIYWYLVDTVDVSKTGTQYFGSFLLCLGAFTPSTIFHVWHNCKSVAAIRDLSFN